MLQVHSARKLCTGDRRMVFSSDATKEGVRASNVHTHFEVNGFVKHIVCLLLAVMIFLTPLVGCATSVPANPMAPPGIGMISTPVPAPTEAPTQEPTEIPTEAPTETPTQEPTETPTEAPTQAPTQEPTEIPTEAPTENPAEGLEVTPEPMTAPALPSGDYTVDDDLLPEDIVKQLDEEVLGYLTGSKEPIQTIKGVRNILLVGVDARPGEKKSRSDTMLILTIDGNSNEIRMTSLMRDMYVAIPGHGNNRINAARYCSTRRQHP